VLFGRGTTAGKLAVTLIASSVISTATRSTRTTECAPSGDANAADAGSSGPNSTVTCWYPVARTIESSDREIETPMKNDNTTPQAEIEARARWAAEKETPSSGSERRPCSASSVMVARNRNLSDRLASLSGWCKSRSEGIHDTETTLTMLKKKVSNIEHRVNQAGWNAHLPECSNCGRSTRETPHFWICNNCGQRHSRQNAIGMAAGAAVPPLKSD